MAKSAAPVIETRQRARIGSLLLKLILIFMEGVPFFGSKTTAKPRTRLEVKAVRDSIGKKP
jgi:hypothetical protein